MPHTLTTAEGVRPSGGVATSLGVKMTKYGHKIIWKAGKFLMAPECLLSKLNLLLSQVLIGMVVIIHLAEQIVSSI